MWCFVVAGLVGSVGLIEALGWCESWICSVVLFFLPFFLLVCVWKVWEVVFLSWTLPSWCCNPRPLIKKGTVDSYAGVFLKPDWDFRRGYTFSCWEAEEDFSEPVENGCGYREGMQRLGRAFPAHHERHEGISFNLLSFAFSFSSTCTCDRLHLSNLIFKSSSHAGWLTAAEWNSSRHYWTSNDVDRVMNKWALTTLLPFLRLDGSFQLETYIYGPTQFLRQVTFHFNRNNDNNEPESCLQNMGKWIFICWDCVSEWVIESLRHILIFYQLGTERAVTRDTPTTWHTTRELVMTN